MLRTTAHAHVHACTRLAAHPGRQAGRRHRAALRRGSLCQSVSACASGSAACRRLAKAVWWSNELARLAAARCDTRTALEAEAYASLMAGHLGLEREADWKMTLARYTRAK